MPLVREVVRFRGHPMVRATHPTTLEVTRHGALTPRGDCIVGVSADRGLADFSQAMRSAIQSDRRAVKVTITTANNRFSFVARGDTRLTLSSQDDIVVRKSLYACGRTLGLDADAAASDLPRGLVRELSSPDCEAVLLVEVETD